MVVPSSSGPTPVRKLQELGATVEVYGKVPPKVGSGGGPEGAEPGLTCSLLFGKPRPEMSPLLPSQ